MYWRTKLFEEDISKMDYIQLAAWIEACRTTVQRDYYNSAYDYFEKMEQFCEEWYAHYLQNTAEYKKEKYRKALAFLQFKQRVRVNYDYGSGVETLSNVISWNRTDFSIFEEDKIISALRQPYSVFYYDILNIFRNTPYRENIAFEEYVESERRWDELQNETEENRTEVQNPDFKKKLHKVISKQLFNKIDVTVRAMKDKTMLEASSFDDFMQKCKKEKELVIKPEYRMMKSSYNEALESMGVSKTLYNDYQNKDKCEKEFDKKFFINLAFALALSYPLAEKLLNYNGYSINNVYRQRDMICKRAFEVGFSRDMAIALIDKKNADIERENKYATLIPNLTSNKKSGK